MLTNTVTSPAQAWEYLTGIVNRSFLGTQTQKMCQDVLDNDAFKNCPGSGGKHHAYQGGLIVHTAQVVQLALAQIDALSSDHFFWESRRNLIIAGIFHDYSKIYEYKWKPVVVNGTTSFEIEKTEFREKIRHVADSYHQFMSVSKHMHWKDRDEIAHMILSHHGRKEWGSPVEPQTLYAQILHNADYLSAFYMGKPL